MSDNAAILALLHASLQVRHGDWIIGAPSHVFAELLSVLEADGYVLMRTSEHNTAVTQRDFWIRLFNRLEVAITHHKRDEEPFGSTEADERLWKAREKILAMAAVGPQGTT